MNELYVLIFILGYFRSFTKSDNILGCGGFVKSHVPIDFSRVEVKLLTKQGILRDKINCAPNNGYYFVPLYDKGEYILELEPPPGWSFNPTKVDLVVDGKSDLCTQGKDINFNFKGFGITGKVESLGSDNGPEGVEVELKTDSESRKTVTSKGGSFFFTPVYPGNYVVRILNSKWKLSKDSVKVFVTEGNTELSPKSLIIQGYDVTGTVKDEGEPIKDTTILIYAQGNSKVNFDECDQTPLPGLPADKKPICHVKTNELGVFKFGAVPHGKYYVTPYCIEHNIYYQPNLIEFEVQHVSVILKQNFEIIGFNVKGRVLKSTNEKTLSNAKILINGKEITKTDNNGIYKLEKIKAGLYSIQAVSDGFLFKEIEVKISPNSKMPDLIPVAYQVCGNVVSDEYQTVTFSQVGATKIITTLSESGTGQFCKFLPPGKYHVQVVVNNADFQRGLQFFPKVQAIEVSSEQTGSIIFSQLKATIVGKVQCLRKNDCNGLVAILKPSGETSDKHNIIINISNNLYKISDINPGLYEITLSSNRLCWKANKQTINVNNINVEIPTFVQTGYSIDFVSSHDTQVSFKPSPQANVKLIEIAKGRMSYCLDTAGKYTFQIDSCHTYETDVLTYNTDSDSNEIQLNAVKHTITLTIESNVNDKEITAKLNVDGVKSQTGPLPYIGNGYQIKLLLSPSGNVVIIPQSDVLYFTPPILSVSGREDCEDLGGRFKALLGVVFQGKVKPALQSVSITVETDNNFDTLLAETDENGVYKFPPLDKEKTYKVTAKKESYVLVGPDENGDFLAHKLAEIVIEVLDKSTRTPLQGTLLSLSGGDSYRSNLQTNENGQITFNSLSPGDYFLRPMMKEYSFEPNSKIVAVKEGQTVNVQLTGRRVAYSAYGQVTSLNREPEENIVVVATGTGNCSHFSEESTSEPSGLFRIRGLQPYCSYDVAIKNIQGGHSIIERSAPKIVHLERITEDVTGLRLVIFRPLTHMDLLVKVFAKNPEHYKSLRLKVVCESSSNGVYNSRVDTSPISITHDTNQGVLVQIPPLPLDGKTYFVHLESNLNNKLEPEPETFTANSSFKYVELDFIVKSNMNEQDIKQTSVWTLVLIFAIMLIVYNIEKVMQGLRDLLGDYVFEFVNFARKKPTISDYNVDIGDIDQIVQSINAVKRKPKPKKVL